jgi:YihY family inner membrane protein
VTASTGTASSAATGRTPAATPESEAGQDVGVDSTGRGSLPTRILASIDDYQRTHRWLAFPFGVFKKFGDDHAGSLAALVAYYGFFSLFPLLLVLVTVLGLVLNGHPELQSRVLGSTLAQFPVIGDQIRSNVGTLKGSGFGMVIGIGGLLWGGLGAMQAAQNAMNGVWNVPYRSRPNFIATKLRALLMLAVLGIGTLATTVLAAAGTFGSGPQLVVRAAGIGLSFVADVGLFLLAFKVLTDLDLRWRQLLPGAIVAAAGWTVLQAVGGYYVGHQLKGASQTYGLFAVVIGLLSWLYLQAQLTLLAAEVNVVRERHLWPRSLTGKRLTEADQRALRAYAAVEERLPIEDVEVDLRLADASDASHEVRSESGSTELAPGERTGDRR